MKNLLIFFSLIITATIATPAQDPMASYTEFTFQGNPNLIKNLTMLGVIVQKPLPISHVDIEFKGYPNTLVALFAKLKANAEHFNSPPLRTKVTDYDSFQTQIAEVKERLSKTSMAQQVQLTVDQNSFTIEAKDLNDQTKLAIKLPTQEVINEIRDHHN